MSVFVDMCPNAQLWVHKSCVSQHKLTLSQRRLLSLTPSLLSFASGFLDRKLYDLPKQAAPKSTRTSMAEPSIVQRLGELCSEIPSADKMTAKGLEDLLKAKINN
jgi:hypothetical protein